MSRPCHWPDGGCGAEVEFYPTGKTKPGSNKPVLQVVDAKPKKGIVLRHRWAVTDEPLSQVDPNELLAVLMDVYTDHHATCPKWAAKVERERATKASAP